MEDKTALRRQLYASKTIEELCSMLETLGKDFRGPKMSRELCDLVYMLKTQRLRHRKDAGSFSRAGGVSSLVRMLPVSEETRDRILLLSTIANVCWLDCSARSQVMNLGLEEIVKILQSSSSNDVINSASRCLANLAIEDAHAATLQQHGIMRHFTSLLSRDDNSPASHKCRQSILRGVRILLCSSSMFRDELKLLEGVSLIVECLKHDVEEVSLSALQALEALMFQEDTDPDTLRPLCELRAVQCIVRLCNHQKTSVRKSAFQLLLCCTKISDGRVVLSSAGGVETLVGAMESIPEDSAMFNDVVRGACVCCREVNSRQRLRDCGGLHKLIKMLSQDKHSELYHTIMTALVCYYFDENTLKVMVRQLGLLGAMKYHLALMMKRSSSNKAPVEEIDQSGESLADCEEEVELMDSEKLTGDSSEVEVEDSDLTDVPSDVMDVGSATRSSSPASTLSLASSSEPASQQKSSSQQSSGGFSSSTPTERAMPGRSCLHPQQEVEMLVAAELSCFEDAIGSVVGGTPSSSSSSSSKRPKLQLELDLSSPMPANFLDSLLSSPNPYQKERKTSESTFLVERNAPFGSQVILMLSRISHLRDFLTYLSSPEMLPGIFDYFAAVKPPDHHVFKVLTRVFMNPHCFQDCISCLLPSKLYELLRITNSTDSTPQVQDQAAISPQLPYLSPPHIVSPECSFHSMCGSLLERLSRVAESPYGQGVLAHSLLRGTDREKHASCLSLPLLCRSPRLCQRMMLGYSGFQLLCDLARGSSGDDDYNDDDAAANDIHEGGVDVQSMALDSLLQLAHNMIRPSSRKRRHSYPSTSDDSPLLDGLPPSKAPRLSFSHQESLPVDLTTPQSYGLSLARGLKGPGLSKCRYADYDHCPFDMIITVENEGSSPQQPPPPLSIQVHRSMLIENSDVFAVMLGGQYMESSRSEVAFHKIPPLAFLSVIHHTYGCGWQCDKVIKRVCESEYFAHIAASNVTAESNEDKRLSVSRHKLNLSLTSDLLISQIVDKCTGETEKRLAEHCLQVLSCAGMFLLPELVTLCEHEAVRYLVPDNISAMFRFAELHWCMCLTESCVRSLVNLPHSNQRTQILRDVITESAQGETALDIIRVFLEQSGE